MSNGAAENGAKRIFDFRFHSAEENLNGLTRFLREIQARAANIDQLREQLDDDNSQMLKAVADASEYVQEVVNRTAPRPDGTTYDPRDARAVRVIRTFAQQASEALNELNDLLQKVRSNTKAIAVGKPDPDILGQNRRDFEAAIGAGQKMLAAIRDDAAKGGATPWQSLRNLSGLWAGSLEYIAGLSLRHDGLGNRIFEIADYSIQELRTASEGLGALAIPGREGAMGVLSLGPEASPPALVQGRLITKIVYLRFPEWTVWALPLAAYELWHIARAEAGFNIARNFYNTMGAQPEEPPHDHLADAFATATMGPAYACAAVLLALEPLSKRDRERAETIIYVLKKIGGAQNIFDAVAKELKELWDGAVAQTNAEPGPPITPDLIAWSDRLLEFISRIQGLRFHTERWFDLRVPWTEYMTGSRDNVDASDDATLRFAVTAAWKARMEKPDTFAQIAPRCEALCRRIMRAGGGRMAAAGRDNWLNLA